MTGTRTRRLRAARPLGAAVMAMGALALVQAAWNPAWIGTLERSLRIYRPGIAPGSLALSGLCLLAAGRGLRLRRSNARWVVLVLLLGDTLAALRGQSGPLPGLGTAVLAVAVIATWSEFDIPRATDVTPAVAKLLGLAAAADLVTGVLLVTVLRALPDPYDHPLEVGRLVMDGLAGRRVLVPDPAAGHWLLPLLTAVGGLSVVLLLAVIMAPPLVPVDGTRPRPSLVRSLADRRDGDTLDPFALRTDKLHHVATVTLPGADCPAGGPAGPARTARASVGYRPIFGVGLASGPPVGDPEAREAALASYLEHCARHGWRPAFIAVGEGEAATLRRLGLTTLSIGDEAVIDVASFRLDTPAMRNVRQAVKRTRNFGVTTTVLRESQVDGELRDRLLALSAAARAGVPERGFSMGLGEPFAGSHPDAVLVVAYGSDGAPVGFQRYAPCRGGAALSLDVMRRAPRSPNGLNERMIAEAVAWGAEHGVEEVSLNFAAFRTLMDLGSGRNRPQRLEYWLVHRLDRWVKIESLYRFNAKFHPRWIPRYVAFRPRDLAWVAAAALTAEFSLRVDRLSVRSAPEWMPVPGSETVPSR